MVTYRGGEKKTYTPREIQAIKTAMTPALLGKANKVGDMLNQFALDNLKRVWSIGAIIVDVKENPEKYGQTELADGSKLPPFDAMAVSLGYSRSFLTQLEAFRRKFNEEELKALLEMRSRAYGRPVTWQNVQRLLWLDNHKTRERLLNQLCENSWDDGQLIEAVDKALNRGAADRHAGGRPVTIPPTLDGRLNNCIKVGGIWARNVDAIYTNGLFGFVHTVETLPADKLTQPLMDKMDAAEDQIDKVIEKAEEVKRELANARETAQRRVEEHVKAQEEKEAEAVDADYVIKDPNMQLEDHSNDEKPADSDGEAPRHRRGAQEPVGT
jgi:hypothetical protein